MRRIAPDGIITTFAGGGGGNDGTPAVSASLFDPIGVRLDAANNLFIADMEHNRVRKVTADGIIHTVAGGGTTLGDGGPATSAQLIYPTNVAFDSGGRMYIAERAGQRVRLVH